jgi:MarR family transcriptional regulator, organic hydroperoxide resistance regulator
MQLLSILAIANHPMSDTSFIFWIGRIRKALRGECEARAAELDITASQLQVLHRLWEGDGILTSALTRDICSDGGTITGLLDRLEAKGLIRRERNTHDRRAVQVFLTPTGRALKEPLMDILTAIDEQALEGFQPEERSQLLGALKRIGANLGTA